MLWQVPLVVQRDAGTVEEEGLPVLVVPRIFLSISFLLARLFVVLAMMRCQTKWRLVGDKRRSPPAVTPSAVSGLVLWPLCWRMIGCPWCRRQVLRRWKLRQAVFVFLELATLSSLVNVVAELRAMLVLGDMRMLNAVFSTPRASSMSSTVRSSRLHVPLVLVTWCVLVGNVLTLWVRVVLHLWDGVRCAVFVKRVLSALRRVLTILILFILSRVVSLTLHVPIASMTPCMRICCARHLVVALHAPHIMHLHVTLVCMSTNGERRNCRRVGEGA